MAKDDKARLYRQIARDSRASIVLARMQTLGFWPRGEGLPPDPPEETAERARIEAELAALRERHATARDPAKALDEERRRRWAESKARRAERKAKRAAEERARREAWAAHRAGTIAHAGGRRQRGLARGRERSRGPRAPAACLSCIRPATWRRCSGSGCRSSAGSRTIVEGRRSSTINVTRSPRRRAASAASRRQNRLSRRLSTGFLSTYSIG